MKIAVYRPEDSPLSMKIYSESVIKILENKGVEFEYFKSVFDLPEDVDIFWDPRVGGGGLPAINKSHTSKPIVATLHGAVLFSMKIKEIRESFSDTFWMKSSRRKFRKGWKKHQADYTKIITVSDYAKKEITENLPINPDKVVPIYHAVDPDLFYFNEFMSEPEMSESYFLHVSVFQPKKNIDRIIYGYLSAESKSTMPRLVIIAPGYPKKIANPKITIFNKQINRADVGNYLQNAFAFVFPSLHESFGLPILEAMACGVPVITSNVTACPEIAGDAAILINPRSVEDISNAMIKIAENKNLRKQLIEKGLERASEFGWEESAKKHLEVFEQSKFFI